MDLRIRHLDARRTIAAILDLPASLARYCFRLWDFLWITASEASS
ncbi:MAG: hypothetical protein JWQ49_513 [Edaphobacter sp.]|nr:hypothetical protein [Edaphobacter sp.]